ncbi:MAG: Gfo/Idh/MocA family oxidoreductase, partial [Phycisphaerae bacterium]|nr:Gfo/Idh/MocA family oxidoreductase [Phycisphaerae bacterium]
MIRVGIIGLGMMGRCHLEGWNKAQGAEVVAVADSDTGVSRQLCRLLLRQRRSILLARMSQTESESRPES